MNASSTQKERTKSHRRCRHREKLTIEYIRHCVLSKSQRRTTETRRRRTFLSLVRDYSAAAIDHWLVDLGKSARENLTDLNQLTELRILRGKSFLSLIRSCPTRTDCWANGKEKKSWRKLWRSRKIYRFFFRLMVCSHVNGKPKSKSTKPKLIFTLAKKVIRKFDFIVCRRRSLRHCCCCCSEKRFNENFRFDIQRRWQKESERYSESLSAIAPSKSIVSGCVIHMLRVNPGSQTKISIIFLVDKSSRSIRFRHKRWTSSTPLTRSRWSRYGKCPKL